MRIWPDFNFSISSMPARMSSGCVLDTDVLSSRPSVMRPTISEYFRFIRMILSAPGGRLARRPPRLARKSRETLPRSRPSPFRAALRQAGVQQAAVQGDVVQRAAVQGTVLRRGGAARTCRAPTANPSSPRHQTRPWASNSARSRESPSTSCAASARAASKTVWRI